MTVHQRVRGALICAWAMLLVAGVGARAQDIGAVVSGALTDADQRPLVGYRVVFYDPEADEVVFSQPADDLGRFLATLRPGTTYEVTALLDTAGGRHALDRPPLLASPGGQLDIRLDEVLPGPADFILPFKSSDRLFLSFIQDAAIVDKQRYEMQLDRSSFDTSDVSIVQAIAAAQLRSIPNLEVGGRLGFGDVDADFGSGGSGLTDFDLWGKIVFPAKHRQQPDYSVGAVITLPTGDADAGLGADALQSEIFASVRFHVAGLSFSGRAGVKVSEQGTLGGVRRDGETAGTAGVAAIVPVLRRATIVVEGVYEGETFEGLGSDARALVGGNIKLTRRGLLRAAFAVGFTDRAPDPEWKLGYAYSF